MLMDIRQSMDIVEAARHFPKKPSPEAVAQAEADGFNTSRLYFHGSNRKFKEFRNGSSDKGINELGVGVYVTYSWNAANAWAGPEGVIYECFIRKGDLFDYAVAPSKETIDRLHNAHSAYMNEKFSSQTGAEDAAWDREDFVDHFFPSGLAKPSGRMSALLNLAGYIGAVDRYSQIRGQVVVFDPSNIRVVAREKGGYWGDRMDGHNTDYGDH